jgi:hypothetical protein
MVFDADRYTLVWADGRAEHQNIHAATLDRNGGPAGADSALLATEASSGRPALTIAGGGTFVAWEETLENGLVAVQSVRAAGGTPSAAAAKLVDSGRAEARPSLAVAFGQPHAAWMADSGGRTAASVVRLTQSGELGTPGPVTLGGTAMTRFPALAGTDSVLAVAYIEGPDEGARVMLALLNDRLETTRTVELRGAMGAAYNPAVGYSGSHWVVAWEDARIGEERIYYTRVDAAGTAEPARMLQDDGSSGNWPKIAFQGELAAIAYYAFPKGAEIFVGIVGPDGAKRGTDLVLTDSPGSARFPTIAFNPSANELGVAWHDTRFVTNDDGNSEIMFARVDCSQ